MKKNTTIVVPIYGDLPSLTQCIGSLIDNVDTSLHKVLLVNDIGPEADAIEKSVLNQIKNKKGFKYERNNENLGFIGTCNRAVYEIDKTDNDILLLNSDTVVTAGFLDEMLDVLYSTYKHGAVCARSNNATIASIPFLRANGNLAIDRDIDYTKKVYGVIKDMLPKYTLTPVAHGFCMLIKRFLIQDFGLFDPIYGLGYNEENDFSMRINQYGFSCVMANKAMVYHLESKSFTSEKKKLLQEKNHKILTNRYPYYESVVVDYLRYGMDPVDRFADVIACVDESPKKILVNFYHMPLAMNGTARNCLSFLDMLKNSSEVKSGAIKPTILASKEAVRFHNLGSFGMDIIQPHGIDQLFHLAICPLQIFHSDNLQLMNRTCLKIVYAHLDIIAIRCNYLLHKSIINRSIFQDSLRIADKIIMISQFTLQDTIAFYQLDKDIIQKKSQVLLQGYPDADFTIDEVDINHSEDESIKNFINEDRYLLVIGNDFKHKMIRETLAKLVKQNRRIVALGAHKNNDEAYKNVLTVESGGLSDSILRMLYRNASIVIFPSLYEGFGLPIAEAAKYRKNILVSDNELNREVAKLYKDYSNVSFFSSLSNLLSLVEKVDKKVKNESNEVDSNDSGFRTITDYNQDIMKVIHLALDEPVDPHALRHRWEYLSRIDQYMVYANDGMGKSGSRSVVERSANFLKSRNQKIYLFARTIYRNTFKKS